MSVCLIIDDEMLHREIDLHTLTKFGFKTKEAPTVKRALDLCQEAMPHVILLDWIMPGMGGMEFLSSLRNMKDGERPFVIVCSANGVSSVVDKAMAAGANGFLLKPFSSDMLRQKLVEGGIRVAK